MVSDPPVIAREGGEPMRDESAVGGRGGGGCGRFVLV